MSTRNQANQEAAFRQQYDGEPSENVGWDDLANSLIGRRLYSNAGTVDYDYENNAIVFSQNGDITNVNDCVIWNLQKPHAAKDDSTLNMHMHYEQDSATDLEFTLRYRIQDNNSAKTTAWAEAVISTNTNNVFTYVSGTLNQICKFAEVDWSASNISATVQFRLTRTDSAGGTVLVTFVDGHYATDQERGSREEYVK